MASATREPTTSVDGPRTVAWVPSLLTLGSFLTVSRTCVYRGSAVIDPRGQCMLTVAVIMYDCAVMKPEARGWAWVEVFSRFGWSWDEYRRGRIINGHTRITDNKQTHSVTRLLPCTVFLSCGRNDGAQLRDPNTAAIPQCQAGGPAASWGGVARRRERVGDRLHDAYAALPLPAQGLPPTLQTLTFAVSTQRPRGDPTQARYGLRRGLLRRREGGEEAESADSPTGRDESADMLRQRGSPGGPERGRRCVTGCLPGGAIAGGFLREVSDICSIILFLLSSLLWLSCAFHFVLYNYWCCAGYIQEVCSPGKFCNNNNNNIYIYIYIYMYKKIVFRTLK